MTPMLNSFRCGFRFPGRRGFVGRYLAHRCRSKKHKRKSSPVASGCHERAPGTRSYRISSTVTMVLTCWIRASWKSIRTVKTCSECCLSIGVDRTQTQDLRGRNSSEDLGDRNREASTVHRETWIYLIAI